MAKMSSHTNCPDLGLSIPAQLLKGIYALAACLFLTSTAHATTNAAPQSPSPQKLIKAALGNYLGARLKERGFKPGASAFIRIFKETSELEMWLKDDTDNGRFRKFKTYRICKWSGKIGPKLFEGDHQSPEGFYAFSPWQLKSQSRNFRAIDIGFPNDLDVAIGRTGSDIQIHGGCGSEGCFAMTDEGIDEIFRLTAAAFGGGQREIMVHSFPFRLTGKALSKRANHASIDFWKKLKTAHDAFEQAHIPPVMAVCNKKYALKAELKDATGCKILKAPTATIAARRRALARAARPKPRIRVRCNLRRPSCRKWLYLQKRILARKDAAKARKKRRTARR